MGRWRIDPRTAALAAIAVISWGLTTHGKYSVTGDEPHYLIISQSLRADHDLNLRNNYANGEGALFGATDLQPEAHARPGRGGALLPVHDIGVAVLVLAPYVAAIHLSAWPPDSLLHWFRMTRGLFAYSIVSLAMIALVTFAAAITMRALESSGSTTAAAITVTMIAWLSPPVLCNSFVVFPEPFALLITAWAVAEWGAAPRPWSARSSAFVLALGALPWMHRKFALYAFAILAILLWRRWRLRTLAPRRELIKAAMLFAAPQVALAVWTLREWGNVAGPLALGGPLFSVDALRVGLPGLLVDRENGLLAWAPVYALLPVAWWLRRKELTPWLLPIAALMIPSAAHVQWWAGFSPAGRFLVPLVPIFCLAGTGLLDVPSTRYVGAALLVPQAAIAAYGWQHPRLLWPRGDGVNRVLSAVNDSLGGAGSWLPSFRTDADQAWVPTLILFGGVLLMNAALALWCSKSMRV